MGLRDLSRRRGSGGDTDLLSDDGTDASFEGVPATGDAQAGRPWCERRIVAEGRSHGRGIVVEVKQPSDPGHMVDQSFPAGQMETGDQVIAVAPNLQGTSQAIDFDRSPVDAARDGLDARDRSRREERHHAVAVEWWVERQAGVEAAVRDEAIRLSAFGPKGRR